MTNNLGNQNIKKLVLILAIPSMLAQFINVLYGIVDRIFISNIPIYGELALAGVGICGPITTLFTSFSFLIGQGGAPLVAMKLGAGDKKSAQKIIANSFLFLIVISFFLTILFLSFQKPILYLFGATDNTYKYAKEYMTIYAIGSIFAITSLGLNSFITCQGYSKIAMTSVLIGAISNIILDPILIFNLNLGVKGAAYATLIGQFLSFIFIIFFLLSKFSAVNLTFKDYSLKTIKQIISIGFSPFLISATDSVILICLNAILKVSVKDNPDLYISANTIVLSFMTLISLPLSGITLGVQPVLSYNFGANNYSRVKEAFKGMLYLCFIYALIMFFFAQFTNQIFIDIFNPTKEVGAIASKAIKIYTLGVILLPIQWSCVDSLVGLGKSSIAIWLSLFRKSLIFILTITFSIIFNPINIFLSESMGDIISSITTGIVFIFYFKKLLNKV